MRMHTNNQMNTKQGDILCSSTELDLGITLKGGQSFRWFSDKDGYRGVFDGCVWTLAQNEKRLFYTVQGQLTDNKDYEKVLSQYFRLDISLEENCKKWGVTDEYFQKSSHGTNGVRILDQDVVENIFSFICSSNNNIQRISGMVEKLCFLFGEKICSIDGKDYYDFPSVHRLIGDGVENVLKAEKFGYRAGYIANAAKRLKELGGREWLSSLHKKKGVSYNAAREQLITLPGIGPKVADCVCLMSLGHLEAIPVDTHIFQIARANYLPHLRNQKTVTPKIHEEVSTHLRKLWGPLAGWAQAVVFCAKINDTGPNREKRRNTENQASTEKKGRRKR